MCMMIERPWQPDDDEDWPSPAEMDDLAEEWTEEAWEAEQARIRDRCYGPLPSHVDRPNAQIPEEVAA